MPARRLYAKAPLVQATVSINVSPPDGFNPEAFDGARHAFEESYASIVPVMRGQLQINFGAAGSSAASNQEMIGLTFSRQDGQQAFRYLANECTFTRNAPYGRWEEFAKDFEPVWLAFVDANPVSSCDRIGLRYVNRFDFPTSEVLLFDYFRVFPALSTDLPQTMDGFFLQTQLSENDYTLVINQGNAQPPSADVLSSIVLDFDIFVQGVPFEKPHEVLRTLDMMHGRINAAFEASITDRAREMIS